MEGALEIASALKVHMSLPAIVHAYIPQVFTVRAIHIVVPGRAKENQYVQFMGIEVGILQYLTLC